MTTQTAAQAPRFKGTNRTRWHKTRKKSARRSSTGNGTSPRISCSFGEAEMQLLTWYAEAKRIPVAEVIRDAVRSHLMPFKNNQTFKDAPLFYGPAAAKKEG